jgi:hypothetical protein
VPAASDFPGLKVYLACDELKDGALTESVGKKAAGKVEAGEVVDGVRGKALRLRHEARGPAAKAGVDLSDLKDVFQIPANGPFTLGVWVRPVESGPGVAPSLLRGEAGTPDTARRLLLVAVTPTTVHVNLHETPTAGAKGTRSVGLSGPSPPTPTWRHLALVRDDKGELQLLVNGVEIDRVQTVPGELKFDTLGLVRSNGLQRSAVDVDELCLFGRALSAEELKKLAGYTGENDLNRPPAPAKEPPAPPPVGPAPKGPVPYTGGPVPAASDFPGLKVYLACDELNGRTLVEAVGKKAAGKVDAGELVDGVRGKALRLGHEAKGPATKLAADLSDLKDAFRIPEGRPRSWPPTCPT